MILIISQDYGEHTTNQVIDWLAYRDASFVRLNGIDFYKNVEVQIDEKGAQVKLKNIDWRNIHAVWFRRWIAFKNGTEVLLHTDSEDQRLEPELKFVYRQFNKNLQSEFKTLTSFFFQWIPREICFDQIFDNEINKLSVLQKAVQFGIKIPATYIITREEQLKKLGSQSLITKAISNFTSIQIDKDSYVGYTSILEKQGLPSTTIAPSKVQTMIEKKYEIRSFYLKGTIYSMAIFSQADEQTKVDFRQYNFEEPNRTIPFQLPEEIEAKLNRLAEHFKLDSCSFDLIKTLDGQYVFLEVNPGGQFGMVSYPCNYYLEEKVANALVTLNNHTYENQITFN